MAPKRAHSAFCGNLTRQRKREGQHEHEVGLDALERARTSYALQIV
jgi:hypothetical protein